MRASYAESEENKLIEEGPDGGNSNGSRSVLESGTNSGKQEQTKLEQLTDDSGYKSMEIVNPHRKDYSIDMKTEEIYRQFTSNTSISDSENSNTIKLTSSGHPSIEETNEEDDEDMVEIFF